MNRTEWGSERDGDRETGTWGEGTERERRGDPGGGREGGAEGGEGEERGGGGGGHGCRWEEFERFYALADGRYLIRADEQGVKADGGIALSTRQHGIRK